MEKIRLDLYLTLKNYVSSRNKACQLIKANKIKVNGKPINKDSFLVQDTDTIEIIDEDNLKYVSRGGLKLEKALNSFKVLLDGLVVLDIGSSTGGFTDCALQNGAKKVYALDVGTNQLAKSLKEDLRVISLENTNFKDINHDLIQEKIDFYVCDVSFISIRTILLKLQEFDKDFTIIILYKPQFEVGKANINKKGLVKSTKILKDSLFDFLAFLKISNIGVLNYDYSPIKGNKQGNIEFLFLLKNQCASIKVDVDRLVDSANNSLKGEK